MGVMRIAGEIIQLQQPLVEQPAPKPKRTRAKRETAADAPASDQASPQS